MDKKIYGIMAEFDTPTDLVDAARKVRDAGFTKTDAFSPFPLHEIDEALGIKRSILPFLVFGGGICGRHALPHVDGGHQPDYGPARLARYPPPSA